MDLTMDARPPVDFGSGLLVGTGQGYVRTMRWVDAGADGPAKMEQVGSYRLEKHALDSLEMAEHGTLLVASRAGSLGWYDMSQEDYSLRMQPSQPHQMPSQKDYLWLLATVWPQASAVVSVVAGTATISVRDGRTLAPRSELVPTKCALNAAALNRNAGTIAVGGDSYDLEVFDLEVSKSVFKARSIKNNNPYAVLRPVTVTAIEFAAKDSSLVCSGLENGQLRVYDPSSSQRRPVCHFDIGEVSPVSSMSAGKECQVVVGNQNGRLALVDLRKPGKLLGVYRNAGAGAIRQVQTVPESSCIASISLDQFTRIHDYSPKTRIPIARLHQKQQITCMSVAARLHPSPPPPPASAGGSGESDESGQEGDEGAEEPKRPRHR